MKSQYTVSTYLLDRLSELGIEHIFGVPGDYNLAFLDDVIAHEKFEWIGNCNEVNYSPLNVLTDCLKWELLGK
ncbi:hypothetical protein AN402_1519 [Bacillus wiedmannii]|nr:hypothetical protein AN402_1519 [Bacillus wiedmannii]